jgi:hypothetical protein
MPRLRPLELVSRSVGREWSLLPPHVSFRTELQALYAAMMRTFCLSAAAIRALSRWDAHGPQLKASATIPNAPAFKTDTISLGMRNPRVAPEPKDRQWNALAGGACAIGGVALIAWLMANHPRHPSSPTVAAASGVTLNSVARVDDGAAHGEREHSQAGSVERPADAPLAWNRARGDLVARNTERAPEIATRAIDTRTSVSSRHAPDSVVGHPAREAHGGGKANAAANVTANASVRHAPHAAARRVETAPRHSLRISADTQLAPIDRPRHLPSIAGAYSPAAPSARFDSEYDAVTMSAGTHVSDIPPAPIHRGRVDTDSTEWMNHMSHRRITEAPESFSK